MSAASLFRNGADASFRLAGTHIVIGHRIYYVVDVLSTAKEPQGLAVLSDCADGMLEIKAPMRLLPESAVTYCPFGYYDSFWLARGPHRARYQGITRASFWMRYSDGSVQEFYAEDVPGLLNLLLSQPKKITNPKRKDKGIILTRRVAVNSSSELHVDGLAVGSVENYKLVETYRPLTTSEIVAISDACITLNGG